MYDNACSNILSIASRLNIIVRRGMNEALAAELR